MREEEDQGLCIEKKSIKRRKIEKEDEIEILEQRANPHIPNDILFDIITKLPSTSLHRFKSVSKEWCSLIEDETFEDFYFDNRKQQAKKETHTISLFGRIGQIYGFYSIDHAGKVSKIRSFCAPSFCDPLVPACNGLLCFLGCGANLEVWNPATNQTIILPKPGFIHGNHTIRLGFGFDIMSRKFKVVGCDGCCSPIQILTLGDKEWRIVQGNNHGMFSEFVMDKVIDVNGVLYWVNTRRKPIVGPNRRRRGQLTITSFNLADEEFGEVPVPDDFINFDNWLCELEGHLCLIGHDGNILDMWVLITNNAEQQEQVEWFNQRIVLPFEMRSIDSIVPIRDGEILVQCQMENCFYLCRYDQDGKVLNTTKVDGLPLCWLVASNYVESLVSLGNYK